jgi:hypothetical protein
MPRGSSLCEARLKDHFHACAFVADSAEERSILRDIQNRQTWSGDARPTSASMVTREVELHRCIRDLAALNDVLEERLIEPSFAGAR